MHKLKQSLIKFIFYDKRLKNQENEETKSKHLAIKTCATWLSKPTTEYICEMPDATNPREEQ